MFHGFFNFSFEGIVTMVTVLFLLWNNLRSCLLRATFNGKSFLVPKDEVKAAYQRAALAEASRLAGGRRLDLDYRWVKNRLVINEKAAETSKK